MSNENKTEIVEELEEVVTIPELEEIEKMDINELESSLYEMCDEYNKAYWNGDFSIAVKVNDAMVEIRNQYTGECRDKLFREIKAYSEDPTARMIYACETLTWESLKFSDKNEGEDKVPTRSVAPVTMFIQLSALNKWLKGRGKSQGESALGAESNWEYMIQKLNHVYAIDRAKAVKADAGTIKSIRDDFLMDKLAKDIELGKNPCSKTNMVKTIQSVFDAMLGESRVKADADDAEFFREAYSTYKKGKLTASTNRTLVEKVLVMCNHKLTGKPYEYVAKLAKK